jgi:protein-disulfide isomerase/uncharacterized membrane protein
MSLKVNDYISEKMRRALVVLTAILMLLVSLYLTQHYFEVKFPEGLSGGSICNINEFFNCDKATNSVLAAPLNTPTSAFGVLIGLVVLLGAFIKRESYQRTLFLILLLNMVGCVGLLTYSLFGLNSICLFCSGYYLLSALALGLFFPRVMQFKPSLYILLVFTFVSALFLFEIRQVVLDKIAATEKADINLRQSVMDEFQAVPQINFDNSSSEFKLNRVPGAKVQMVIFSDFECPACKMLSTQIAEIVESYKTKVDISYYFYPLDQACNENVKRVMHLHACRAAAAAICLPVEDFYQLHEELFANQDYFEQGFVEQMIVEKKIESCVASKETQVHLKKIIQLAAPVDVQSTPTFLINGRKFEGAIPMYKMKIILDELTK